MSSSSHLLPLPWIGFFTSLKFFLLCSVQRIVEYPPTSILPPNKLCDARPVLRCFFFAIHTSPRTCSRMICSNSRTLHHPPSTSAQSSMYHFYPVASAYRLTKPAFLKLLVYFGATLGWRKQWILPSCTLLPDVARHRRSVTSFALLVSARPANDDSWPDLFPVQWKYADAVY